MKTILCLPVIGLLFVSCSISNKSFSDYNKCVPADFNINKDVLLVQTFPGKKKWNEDMNNFLSKNYPGKYVIVSQNEIIDKSGKYSDVTKYRFAFQWDVKTRFRPSSGFTDYDPYGNFYDRLLGRTYATTRKYNNYGSKAFIPFFNSIIKYSASKSPALTKN